MRFLSPSAKISQQSNATGWRRNWSHLREEPQLAASDDLADVERVLAGDTVAFERIVCRWQRPLINLAFRFCHDPARAEDMAQEAFLRAYRALNGWRRDAAFSTWLFALATNMYRSELRRIPAKTFSLDEVAELSDTAGTVHEALEDEGRDRVVRRAVFGLPSKYRESLILFYFHDMDVSAAALSLGLPEGTVKARLSRGREILRSKLPRLLETPGLKEA